MPTYGSPAQLRLTDIATPVPDHDHVLVRVQATSVNPYDWHNVRGEPYVARLMTGGLGGLRRPKLEIPGCDMAGLVEAVGRDVAMYRPGDAVFGLLEQGGFGEYVSVPHQLLAPKPKNLSYAQAAAIPMAGVTAMVALHEAGRVQPGQRVLITGASGGVGTFAVQIAAALGADVTAVCRTRNVDLVRSLGAHLVVDDSLQDFTRASARYDLVVDIAGTRPLAAARRVIEATGTFVTVGGPAGRWLQPAGRAFATLALGPLGSQRMVVADTLRSPAKRQYLLDLAALIEAGSVRPVVDRSFAFEDLPAAVSYQEQGHPAGKVVVDYTL